MLVRAVLVAWQRHTSTMKSCYDEQAPIEDSLPQPRNASLGLEGRSRSAAALSAGLSLPPLEGWKGVGRGEWQCHAEASDWLRKQQDGGVAESTVTFLHIPTDELWAMARGRFCRVDAYQSALGALLAPGTSAQLRACFLAWHATAGVRRQWRHKIAIMADGEEAGETADASLLLIRTAFRTPSSYPARRNVAAGGGSDGVGSASSSVAMESIKVVVLDAPQAHIYRSPKLIASAEALEVRIDESVVDSSADTTAETKERHHLSIGMVLRCCRRRRDSG